jgi:peroxiredoxin
MIARTLPYLMIAIIMAVAVFPARAAVEIGKPAPAISATDVHGNEFNLDDHKGKIVVLEWFNKGCPFVQKHYDVNNMQKLQKDAAANDVAWVTIISSAEGKQGYVTSEEALADIESYGAAPTTLIRDVSGEIGKAYDAKTTPHMFVIDAEGNVAYAGAIDSNSSANPDTIEGAENYVTAAIDSLKAGEAVETTTTSPYGCAVKY